MHGRCYSRKEENITMASLEEEHYQQTAPTGQGNSLLSKTRQINRLLQRSENVEYNGISRVLSDVLGANVYITNRQGRVYGYAFVM